MCEAAGLQLKATGYHKQTLPVASMCTVRNCTIVQHEEAAGDTFVAWALYSAYRDFGP